MTSRDEVLILVNFQASGLPIPYLLMLVKFMVINSTCLCTPHALTFPMLGKFPCS